MSASSCAFGTELGAVDHRSPVLGAGAAERVVAARPGAAAAATPQRSPESAARSNRSRGLSLRGGQGARETTLLKSGVKLALGGDPMPGDTLGIDVPTLCYSDRMAPYGACRTCLVEVDGRKPVASCHTPVTDGLSYNRHFEIELLI